MEFVFETFGEICGAGKPYFESNFRDIPEFFPQQLSGPFQAIGQDELIGSFTGQGMYFPEKVGAAHKKFLT